MHRPKSICNYPGCSKLLDRPGYCVDHKKTIRSKFDKLDSKKTPAQKKFYSSYAWTKKSKSHRIKEPLCRQCNTKGKKVIGKLVHHNPCLQDLWDKGLNPLDDKYIETLCISCHNRELALKRKKKFI